MREVLVRTSLKLRPMPPGRWSMTQRWNDLLYAHWPVPLSSLAHLIPDSLQADTFQGSAWLGALPFWMDRIKMRGLPAIPGANSFPGLNLRTYVRDPRTGARGVLLLSVDANSLLAAVVGRAFFHFPYFWSEMRMEQRTEREFSFYSRRRLSTRPVVFSARYRGLGPTRKLAENRVGTLEYFLTERNCLFSLNRAGQLVQANIHSVPAPLEEAEAEIERNDLPAALGIPLPGSEPVLHYSRRLAVYIWPPERVHPALVPRPVAAAVTPLG